MSADEIKIIFQKLDALDDRIRSVEVRMAFGAGLIVAAQVLVSLFV